MNIKELLEEAQKEKMVDLQAAIMLVVFEKKALSLEDDANKMDYFLQDRWTGMNRVIGEYKEQIGLKYEPKLYEATAGETVYYVKAMNENEVKGFVKSIGGGKVDRIDPLLRDEVMQMSDPDGKLRMELTAGNWGDGLQKSPALLTKFHDLGAKYRTPKEKGMEMEM